MTDEAGSGRTPRLLRLLLGSMGDALAERPLQLMLAGLVLVGTGGAIIVPVVGWMVWEETKSALSIGIITSMPLLALLLVVPFASILADRTNRFRLLWLSHLACALGLAILGGVVAAGLGSAWALAVGLSVVGVATAFGSPVLLCIVPRLVPRRLLIAALVLVGGASSLGEVGRLLVFDLMPLERGAMYGFGGAAIAELVFLGFLFRIRLRPSGRFTPSGKPFLTDLADGVRYVRRHVGLGPLVGVNLLVLFAVALAPELKQAAGAFGIQTFVGFQMLAVLALFVFSFWLGYRSAPFGLTRMVLVLAIAAMPLAVVATTGVSAWIAASAVTLLGVAVAALGVCVSMLAQLNVAEHMRGRLVGGLTWLAAMSASLGWLLSKVGADMLGWTATTQWSPVVLIVAGITLVVALRLYRRGEPLRATLESPATLHAPVEP
ncbi:MAG: MFS transporter [Alphaproteobacteria bacterium]